MQVKRPCAPFRCDDAAEMQVEGLDALENAAGPDCLWLARQMRSLQLDDIHSS
jgi:hypothetical protein